MPQNNPLFLRKAEKLSQKKWNTIQQQVNSYVTADVAAEQCLQKAKNFAASSAVLPEWKLSEQEWGTQPQQMTKRTSMDIMLNIKSRV